MANGGEKGTSGWPRVQWGPWWLIACIGAAISVVNATSVLMEHARDGHALPVWAPFLWEFSSWVMLLVLAPVVGEAIRRAPPRRESALRFGLIHLGLILTFSIIHVTGMVTIRKLGYWLAGEFYDFSHGNLPLTFLYEARKDAISYALFAIIYYLFQRRAAAAPAAPADERIEIRDGAAAVFVAPSDILFVEAAGNYVEFHTAAKSHLVRGTLATWEAKLAARGFVRVHRSRLVNRAHVSAVKPTPSGDVELTLSDGRTLAGSRRYRTALEAAPAA
ncbi:LytTR family DNA-binding domain-containing protein [Terricaulis sp.]|uniref:LytTR family DNA-binding domain-containing protein n=1 Tax=Terricaulis sp. TaxID=2768686 RepID=UPI003784CD51